MSRNLPLTPPRGYHRFHRSGYLNYQFNRAHGLGLADAADLWRGVALVSGGPDVPEVFQAIGEQAVDEGRYRAASGALRLAEFFTPGRDQEKLPRYTRFREAFDLAFPELATARVEVPYRTGFLPAYRLAGGDRGTVLVHGGFDSLIEEFVGVWQLVAEAGFDVVAFDGPGQGGARRLAGLTFEHDWENPVTAVLDWFGLEQTALVGISMGGYWALRAAAFEPRVTQVVSWPPVYDWLLSLPTWLRPATRWMLRRRGFMRWSVRTRARLVPTLACVVDQALYNLDSADPVDIVDWFGGMNPEHLCSDRITQDVLVLAGEHDRFQPPKFARAQVAALVNARSVTTRLFTAAENADQHCQLGNLPLVGEVLIDWLSRDR